jgi:hypothetical protein
MWTVDRVLTKHGPRFTVHDSGRGRSRFDVELGAHPVDESFDLERLVQEVIGSSETKFLDLVFLDHAGDAQHADIFQRGIGTHPLANFLAVDIGQHDVQNDQVRVVFLDHHAGVEAVLSDADLEASVVIQHFADEFDQFGVVIDQKHLALAALQGIRGDAVVLHEFVEGLAGNPAEP